MRDEAERRIGHLYPKATLTGRTAGHRYRMALGQNRHMPEPRLPIGDAPCAQFLARQEEG